MRPRRRAPVSLSLPPVPAFARHGVAIASLRLTMPVSLQPVSRRYNLLGALTPTSRPMRVSSDPEPVEMGEAAHRTAGERAHYREAPRDSHPHLI